MKCHACGFEWSEETETCPACGAPTREETSGTGEDIYHRGVLAEKAGKKNTAARHYAAAADLGVPLAAWGVCRCLDRAENPDLYEFWLLTASERDPIAAMAYATYLRRGGDGIGAFRYLHRAAALGSDEAREKLAWYYLRHKNRPAARYYLNRTHGRCFAAVLRLFVGRAPEYAPETPVAPDDTVEMYNIGAYAERLGLPHIAFSYYEKAADASYLKAVERVAEMYMRGQGVTRDVRNVVKYLRILGAAGKTEAYLTLADYYETGLLDGAPNPAAATEVYRLAADHGDVRGMTLLADRLADGIGTDRAPEEALTLYDRAAALGSEDAKKRAAALRRVAAEEYAAGVKVSETNPADAYRHFRNAAATGHAEALCAVGDALIAGSGCDKDNHAAVDAYLRAAERGSARALYRMGCLYLYNYGVRYDEKLARACLTGAKRGGIAAADAKLTELENRKKRHAAQKLYAASCVIYHRGDHASAAKFRYAAAKLGHAKATYLLGCMYDCGDALPKDAARANVLYARAKLLGFDGKETGFYGKYLRGLNDMK